MPRACLIRCVASLTAVDEMRIIVFIFMLNIKIPTTYNYDHIHNIIGYNFIPWKKMIEFFILIHLVTLEESQQIGGSTEINQS